MHHNMVHNRGNNSTVGGNSSVASTEAFNRPHEPYSRTHLQPWLFILCSISASITLLVLASYILSSTHSSFLLFYLLYNIASVKLSWSRVVNFDLHSKRDLRLHKPGNPQPHLSLNITAISAKSSPVILIFLYQHHSLNHPSPASRRQFLAKPLTAWLCI